MGFGLVNENDLEPNTGEALKMEQPTDIVTRPLAMNDQGDRIRAIFNLTTDDPLSDVEYDTLAVYYQYLSITCRFHFELNINQKIVAPEVRPTW